MAKRNSTTVGASPDRIDGDSIRRFDVHQRIQHIMLFSSFIILAITGLPMKFSDWHSSQWWIGVWGGIDNLRSVHHAAAFIMIGSCVYHLGYMLVSLVVLKRPFPTHMLPKLQDVKDLILDMKYYVGLSDVKAEYGRFSYWAVGWGMVIMIGGGFVLMFPVGAAKLLPGWIVPLALVAHSDEAVLAVGWILVVHMYFAHLHPLVFPMNKAIFTGKVPMHLYKEEHGLEFAQIMAAANLPLDHAPAGEPKAPVTAPVPADLPRIHEPGIAEPA